MKTTYVIAFAFALFAGCSKHDTKAPAATGSASSAALTASGAAMKGSAAPTGGAATPDVPTSADFEAKAATEITDKNLDSSLAEIEKDLGE